MQSWNLMEIDTPEGSRSPVVLHSEDGEARAVLIGLKPGQRLGDHQVKEAAMLVVVDGAVDVEAGGEQRVGRAGTMLQVRPRRAPLGLERVGGEAAARARSLAGRRALPRQRAR